MVQILLMSSNPLLAIAELLFPKVVIEYFDLTNHKAQAEEIHFYFKEDNSTPAKLKDQKLTSNGFFAEATLQYFPIRGKQVFLHITRPRWINETTGKAVSRD